MRIALSALGFIGMCLVGNEPPTTSVAPDPQALAGMAERIRPLHAKLREPAPHDWLEAHPEPGQTFQEYIGSDPVIPRGQRHVVYIQPLGEFMEPQRNIVTLTVEYMEYCFGLPVKIKDTLPLSVIPARAQRRHPTWGTPQILTKYVLHDLLRPHLPDDAAAYLAFTTSDLWPREGWNFVFGQASRSERVGVWSIHRNGNPEQDEASFRLCLMRTIKTAVHETGHMFSMRHCTRYACGMNGSNHREESDRRPLWLCPECVAKVWWATGVDPVRRYETLADFAGRQGMEQEQAFFEKSAQMLREARRAD